MNPENQDTEYNEAIAGIHFPPIVKKAPTIREINAALLIPDPPKE